MNLIKEKNYFLILLILTLIVILPKWIIGANFFELDIVVNLLVNFVDIQYLPIILSFSEFNFSPTYLDKIKVEGVIGFPILPLLFHSIFYKLFGPYSLILSNLIFKFFLFFFIFKFFEKFFNSKKISLIFCVLSFAFFSFFNFIYFRFDIEILNSIWSIFKNFFGFKVPRPAFSSIFLFLNLYLLLIFKEKIKNNLSFKYIILLSFSFAMLINTHFYSFLILIPVALMILIFEKKNQLFNFLKKNFLRVLLFILFLFIFSLPFLLQLFFSNEDYNIRIGVIELEINQKIFFIKYFVNKLLSLELVLLFIIATFIHIYFRKKNEQKFHLDIFYYLIISSIITPIIFVFLSPKIINLSHFISYILFSFFGFFFCLIFFILYNSVKKFNLKIVNQSLNLSIYLIILLSSFFVINEQFTKIKNNIHLEDLKAIQKYFNRNNQDINFKEKKLFTNHLTIQNLWLLNGNKNVLVSDAFTNVLPKDKIEYFLFNSLKSIGVLEEKFEKYLFEKNIISRDHLIMFISNYRYQGNALYQYQDLKNYNSDSIKKIKKASPFNNQSNILPENEKKYLIRGYNAHKIDEDVIPDMVILRISELNKNLIVENTEYIKKFSGKNFVLYYKN